MNEPLDPTNPLRTEAAAVPEATPTVADDGAVPVFAPLTEGPGAVIGHYKLLQKIGEGGFGAVYMAEQQEPVRRRVALKVIKLGMDTKAVIARFEAERQALALMDHPNIAKVLDTGATATGRPYFVMELVKGIRITDYCDQNNLSTTERLGLFMQVCHAIQHAHQKGIIHRDIKPSNILVTLHDGVPVPKVIDFGIAKATTDQRLTDMTLFTALDQFLGTPAYMSPEQAEQSGLDIDTRSDIYALGVLLYELLTGHTPFDSKRLVKAGLAEIRRIIREEEPLRPSTRISTLSGDEQTSIAKHRQSEPPKLQGIIRGDLDWIVMKTLEKDRTRRYESSSGLAADIQRYLSNEPVVARPPSRVYRMQKLVRRNKLVCAASGAVVVALLLGLALATWAFIGERKQRQETELARVRESSQRQRAEANEKRALQETERADAAAAQAKKILSTSDFLQALRFIQEDKTPDAVAFLVRSLEMNPNNGAAATRLVTLLSQRAWLLPVASASTTNRSSERLSPELERNAIQTAEFSPDGLSILTMGKEGDMRLWDARTCQLLSTIGGGGYLLEPQGQPAAIPFNGAKTFAHFSPDGRWIVTSGTEGPVSKMRDCVRVWDAKTGKAVAKPLAVEEAIYYATIPDFSPDGQRLAIAYQDGTAWIWDVGTGQPSAGPFKHERWNLPARFSPDGKSLLTVSKDGTRLFDTKTGELLLGPFGESYPSSARFSPDSKSVLVTGFNGLRWFNARSGRLADPSFKDVRSVDSAEQSPDGLLVLTSSSDGTVRLWDAKTAQPLTEPLKHRDRVESIEFSPDGQYILTISGGVVRVCQWGRSVAMRLMDSGLIHSVQFSPEGKRVMTTASSAPGGTTHVWDAETGKLLAEQVLRKHPESTALGCVVARFSPDGQSILSAAPANPARVWSASTGLVLFELAMNGRHRTGLDASPQFSPTGECVLTVSSKQVRVWDAQTGRPLSSPLEHDHEVDDAQFSADGTRILTAAGKARVWDAITGRLLLKFGPDQFEVFGAQFSPDGKRIFTSGQSAQVWDARTGKLLMELLTQPLEGFSGGRQFGGGTPAQFSADGKRVLSVDWGKGSRVWDAQTGLPLTEMLAHMQLSGAEFSPDATRVVTSARDGAVLVWDAETGQPVADPSQRGMGWIPARFSPDGRRIVSARSYGTVLIWDVAPCGPCPGWVLDLAQAVCGERLNVRGVLELTNGIVLLKAVRSSLDLKPMNDDWAIWGRWFLAPPATRTISPYSRITVPEWIEEAITDGTTNYMAEVNQLAWGEPEQVKRIATASVLLPKITGDSLDHLDSDQIRFRAQTVMELKTRNPEVLNGLAYTLATSRDPKVRDGATAILLGEKAVAVTQRRNPALLDTLASAYAEAGEFSKAVAVQEEAIGFLEDEKQKIEFSSRLKLYQAQKPYRQP